MQHNNAVDGNLKEKERAKLSKKKKIDNKSAKALSNI